MTDREELKVIAQRMYSQGRNKMEISRGLGVARATIGRWVDPEEAERGRAVARAWKAANPERVQQIEANSRSWCACGGVKSREHAMCSRCSRTQQAQKYAQIVELWETGMPIRDIAAEIGLTPSSLSVAIYRLRKAGVPLPFRRRAAVS